MTPFWYENDNIVCTWKLSMQCNGKIKIFIAKFGGKNCKNIFVVKDNAAQRTFEAELN